jgi:hypothetical protein
MSFSPRIPVAADMMKHGIERHGIEDVLFVVRVERWNVVEFN